MVETQRKATVTSQGTQKILESAQKKANEIGVPSAIAIVDESGVLKGFDRMDGAPLASVQVAQDKAYSAAATGVSTDQWYDIAQADPKFGWGIPTGIERMCPIGGGYPITDGDGQVVGGIGVSGGTYQQDMEVAEAGLGN